MKVVNIHQRTIDQPKEKIVSLIETLSTKEDKVWPKEQWPKMRLNKGLVVGSKGGHGPIGYTIHQYQPGELIEFEFTKPQGFNGFHRFEIEPLSENQTSVKHIIDINTTGLGLLSWPLAIRWLHDALIEDAFDKIENQFLSEPKRTEWNLWVKMLRTILT